MSEESKKSKREKVINTIKDIISFASVLIAAMKYVKDVKRNS